MMKTLRGVNLGGWLILERWMTPGLFSGTSARDEYEFMQTDDARSKLREHQKTFIREEDFKWMQHHGIDAVRIPVGYWIFDGDGPYRSCIGRLDWAVRVAKKYNIDVLICLHGAPGSQNGFDHSGKIGQSNWYDDKKYRTQTVDVLCRLAERYSSDSNVWGLELLNEPKAKFWQPTLRGFYRQAYKAIRQVARPGLHIVFSDAFTPRLMSGVLSPHRNYPVVMDHHWYHFFLPGWFQRRLSFRWYYLYLAYKRAVLERLSRAQPVIIGEWSGIIGGEKLNQYPERDHAKIVDEHIAQQLEAYGPLAGWFYWSYKHEYGGVFNFRDMVEKGRISLE